MLGVSALVGVCLLVAGGILTARHGAIRDEGPRGALLRPVAVAAITALLCAVMYLADYNGASGLPLVIANGSMVLAPAMIWVAMSRAGGRSPLAVVVALSLTAVAAAATALAPGVVAGAVKVGALLVVCALAAAETCRSPVAGLRGARLIRAVMIGYAAFCALRMAISAAFGFAPAYAAWGAMTQLTTLLGVLAVVLSGAGTWLMAAHLGDADAHRAPGRDEIREWVRTRLEAGEPVVLFTLSLPDLPLIRAAHGAARAESIQAALRRAAVDVAPAGAPVAA
ncbi:MAG: hypothetical protein QM626_12035, partial [Microbacterium sp.]|uniref:hypothetical protein n=1 Tax=Microbacterium sp. TaxID=51671 RepID=UPI0039E2B062